MMELILMALAFLLGGFGVELPFPCWRWPDFGCTAGTCSNSPPCSEI